MPEEVAFNDGDSIKFFYSAEGEKLRTVYTISSAISQKDYCGNIVYEAGVQKYLLNDEGYYDLASGARHYDPAIARWITQDPLAEKYYGWNQYKYCGANPVNAIDKEGKLVIFVNGFFANPNEAASPNYWEGFDNVMMNHFNDYNKMYLDGSIGGIFNIMSNEDYSNIYPINRFQMGYITGKSIAHNLISKLQRDEKGFITEQIKVVTHSMGSVYSKGLLKAITEYIESNPNLCDGISIAEYNFAPFQPWAFHAVEGVDTYQLSHKYDRIAGDIEIPGSKQIKTKNHKDYKHSIKYFFDYIKGLEEGKYRYLNGEFVKEE